MLKKKHTNVYTHTWEMIKWKCDDQLNKIEAKAQGEISNNGDLYNLTKCSKQQ